ncbi:MarR family winged helix-turn-helix transcriptional regulator [Staphylococcus carnosus]|uniref:HTH marR-type domain-containing protein n=2 Tax=Staphylococcus carnosus TaxID=1281 RepID=B9DM12_STACT|nr:MarR family transcriptional regulator [Staphylococcus carnosus]ANZ32738.1 MarR family transcriptional regulator [Staphylococcus carnosus]KKB25285.1 MarR family transcriptional regulator [Staphylococcus carnosus]POA05130.1 MarR family transcriptional regulator [Staphylococcus carnosus]QPT04749.1 winged helix DNA-binding protein [Staphylococcus carnosus]QQS84630.1 winged helix DNA-binding protein [Staphylococcus carnosus]
MDVNQLFNSFTELYRPYIKRIQPILDKYDLHTAQFLVLKDIYLHEQTTLVQISKRRSIEKPSARKLLKVLIEQELLIITQGEDKREKLISLSDKGFRVYQEAMDDITAFQESVIDQAALNEKEINAAVQTFEKLKNIL